MENHRIVTVGELREWLAPFPDDWEITFSGGLELHRLKTRGDRLVNVEFNQMVYRDKEGRWVVDGLEE